MGYFRVSVQRLCGSPLFLSPPRTAAALLCDSRQSHKYKKKKATSPHISFSSKSSPLILPGDLSQGLVTTCSYLTTGKEIPWGVMDVGGQPP